MCFRRTPMNREGQPRSTIALLVTVVLIVSVVALIASTRPAAPASTTSTSATASKPQGSETATTSQSSTLSTVSTTTSSAISRVADTQSTYTANTTLSSSVTTVTGTNITMTNCNPLGGATMELQVVSDATGMSVKQGAPAVSTVFQSGCNGFEGQSTGTLYFDRVSEGSYGWFDLINNSTHNIAGAYNVTVSYAGSAYSFRAGSYPATTTCATLAVPSGVVTLTSYQFSNYDCAGNLGAWAKNPDYFYAAGGCLFKQVYLRVLSDSDSASVAGAVVTTTYDFADVCNDRPSQSFASFTTTSTEWYAFGDTANSFTVEYGGQTYNVTASQTATSTCVTLSVPSGAVDMTYGVSCAATGSSTTAQSSTTSTSTTVNLSNCNGPPANTLLNPAPKGTVYMKVVNDQGTVITNGTLFVFSSGNQIDGNHLTRSDYCISLGDVNGTGYLQLAVINGTGGAAENSTFLTSGVYDVTLMAGYDQGPGYTATIPTIQVQPNSTIYITVSVPSGVVTIVTSNDVSTAITTTTTSATTVKNGA